MSAVVRLGDLVIGHGSCSNHKMATGSSNVFINGIPACKVGDTTTTHCTHVGHISSGSSKVFVNGAPIARVGDKVSCGSTLGAGSSNVNSN